MVMGYPYFMKPPYSQQQSPFLWDNPTQVVGICWVSCDIVDITKKNAGGGTRWQKGFQRTYYQYQQNPFSGLQSKHCALEIDLGMSENWKYPYKWLMPRKLWQSRRDVFNGWFSQHLQVPHVPKPQIRNRDEHPQVCIPNSHHKKRPEYNYINILSSWDPTMIAIARPR